MIEDIIEQKKRIKDMIDKARKKRIEYTIAIDRIVSFISELNIVMDNISAQEKLYTKKITGGHFDEKKAAKLVRKVNESFSRAEKLRDKMGGGK